MKYLQGFLAPERVILCESTVQMLMQSTRGNLISSINWTCWDFDAVNPKCNIQVIIIICLLNFSHTLPPKSTKRYFIQSTTIYLSHPVNLRDVQGFEPMVVLKLRANAVATSPDTPWTEPGSWAAMPERSGESLEGFGKEPAGRRCFHWVLQLLFRITWPAQSLPEEKLIIKYLVQEEDSLPLQFCLLPEI